MDNTHNKRVFGEDFWKIYDAFCAPDHLSELMKGNITKLTLAMRRIISDIHSAGVMSSISRPSRMWETQTAWVALRDETVLDGCGERYTHIRTGEVMYINQGFDRDIVITHSPVLESVSGYLLSGKWPNMIGLFMPLFDLTTIHVCIQLRLKKNEEDCLQKVALELSD